MAGLRIRRPDNGAVILELTDRITRVFGTITITAANRSGSFVFGGDDGIPWYFIRMPDGVQQPSGPTGTYPASGSVSLSGRTLTWDSAPLGARLVVGVY